jgi:rsbT co-antagonist protein RsbR
MDEAPQLSERSLLEKLGLDTADLERRKRLVLFTPDDARATQALQPVVSAHLDALVKGFFDYLERTGEAQGLLDAPELYQRARALKREHLLQMVSGEYGLRYLEQRVELAQVYSRAGLSTAAFLGAFQDLLTHIGNLVAKSGDDGFAALVSLRKLAVLDIAVIVDVIVFQRERVIRHQQEAIRELSTPVLQVREKMLLLPIIGVLDSDRARMVTENLLHAIRDHRARVVVLELTGVAHVDTQVANNLMQTISAASMMGARVIVTGFSAEVAQALTALGLDLAQLDTHGDLQSGLEQAENFLGYRLTKIASP